MAALKAYLVQGTTHLEWNEVTGADRYEVWIKSRFSEYTLLYYGKALCFIHYTAKPGVKYKYYVRVLDVYCKEIEKSNIVESRAQLAVPRISASIDKSGKPMLEWTAVQGAKRYFIYRQKEGEKELKLSKRTKTTVFLDYECNPGEEYFYQVEAGGWFGKRSLSSSAIGLEGLHKAEQFRTAISKTGFPLISWDFPDGAVACHIYRTENKGDIPEEIAVRTDTNSYINTSAVFRQNYYYMIRMEYEDGVLSAPAPLREMRRPDVNDELELRAERNKKDNLKLSWNAIEDAEKYQIFMARKFSANKYEKIFETNNTYYINSAYHFDEIRYYRVRAIYRDGLKGTMSKIVKIEPSLS